jgi:hypothetical protein
MFGVDQCDVVRYSVIVWYHAMVPWYVLYSIMYGTVPTIPNLYVLFTYVLFSQPDNDM